MLTILVPRKGLSHSAKVAGRYGGGKDVRRIKSDHLQEQPVYMDNYSFV